MSDYSVQLRAIFGHDGFRALHKFEAALKWFKALKESSLRPLCNRMTKYAAKILASLKSKANFRSRKIIDRLIELPIFTCQAHVFSINPQTKKSWLPSSTSAIDVNFYYDSSKNCYRIVSVEDLPGTGKKVVINSMLTEKMTFKKTSQKFGQWADAKTGGVHGLGFSTEADLTKVVIEHSIDNTRSGSLHSQGHLIHNQQPATNSTSSSSSSPPPPPVQLPSSTSVTSAGSDSLQRQLWQAQAHARRLEIELSAVKRSAGGGFNTSLSGHDNTLDGMSTGRLDVNGGLLDSPPSSGHSPFHSQLQPRGGTNGCGSTIDSNYSSAGLDVKPLASAFDNLGLQPQRRSAAPVSESSLVSLYLRLGEILREAVDLHQQLGSLMMLNGNGS